MTNKEAIECIEAIHVQMFNSGNSKWTEACDMAIEALQDRPHGKWEFDDLDNDYRCSKCHEFNDFAEWIDRSDGGRIRYPFWERYECSKCGAKSENTNFCPNCGASMSANDRQVTGKLNSDTEYKAKVKELENAIAKCEKAEEDFKKRTCKFKSPRNCDFCAFCSDCEECWKEGKQND